MNYHGIEIESMEEMEKRLHGCGSGERLRAVIAAISIIKAAGGILDANNRIVVLFHLTVALVDEYHAAETISDTAQHFGCGSDFAQRVENHYGWPRLKKVRD
jgi:hypothetical protein